MYGTRRERIRLALGRFIIINRLVLLLLTWSVYRRRCIVRDTSACVSCGHFERGGGTDGQRTQRTRLVLGPSETNNKHIIIDYYTIVFGTYREGSLIIQNE